MDVAALKVRSRLPHCEDTHVIGIIIEWADRFSRKIHIKILRNSLYVLYA
jgi:hypothetical protein